MMQNEPEECFPAQAASVPAAGKSAGNYPCRPLAAAVAGFAALLAGCANLGYYAQAVEGHLAIQQRTRPISEVVGDSTTAENLKRSLSVVSALREFAVRELRLPNNGSFTTYADLGRPYAVWNVSAAPELSMELEKWCFVAVGCVSYRGFFSMSEAERFAQELRAKGYDVALGGVRAYSTLGWFREPLLNTFLGYSDTEMAQLIFHELAHQVVHVRDDTAFNESFATAVELEGINRWLDRNGTEAQREAFIASRKRKTSYTTILLEYRARLKRLFASGESDVEKRETKARIFDELHEKLADFGTAKAAVRRAPVAPTKLNNADLATVSTYTGLVPAFQALLQQQGGNLPLFYERVKEIARLPAPERMAVLREVEASASANGMDAGSAGPVIQGMADRQDPAIASRLNDND
jgi:predicted aminopeptidase